MPHYVANILNYFLYTRICPKNTLNGPIFFTKSLHIFYIFNIFAATFTITLISKSLSCRRLTTKKKE